jgi:tRNA(Ile)-lysidine synthase
MHPLVRHVGEAISERRLLSNGDAVAVAVSGGADSVALALILKALARRAGWRLAGIIHVHHGLRPEAAADESFVALLAHRLSLPVDTTRVDVPALVRAARRSVESVAREARYRAFDAAAVRLGATVVATGHTLDDQAETVMLRLLRGAGHRGLSAIRSRRGIYVRPLLDCRRAELREFLAARGEPFCEDASNDDRSVPRNRLRHGLMPIIDEVAPRGAAALARFARLAADDERELARQAREAAGVGVRGEAGGVQLDRAWLAGLPTAIARRVVRDALEQVGGMAALRDIQRILDLGKRAAPEGRLDLFRAVVRCAGPHLWLGPAGSAPRPRAFEIPLSLPGEAHLPETDTTLVASFLREAPPSTSDPNRAILQAWSLEEPLAVRSRRPGDRFRPFGSPGSRKLQDVFVDRKIPRAERDSVPVVVDASGRIVWVAGVTIAHDCRVTMPEAGMVILELKKGHQ